jgi:ABC-type uncharacterized transport system substrate-binding protein
MKRGKYFFIFLCGLSLALAGPAVSGKAQAKKKIMVVSSYHREYLWSQETNKGFREAMLKYGYFETPEQAAEYGKNDFVEAGKAVVKKAWMDAKRKKSRAEKIQMSARILAAIREFKPDLVFLGDDDAAEYVGTQMLDSKTPLVFWGVNNTPVKYGLVESAERPGHNATGIYQPGYYEESLLLLKKIVPSAKTFAVLTDDTTAGRSHYKAIQHLAAEGRLPLKLTETVVTGDYELFKARVLELQNKVDAFFIAQYSSLLDGSGRYVSAYEVSSWYLRNSRVPETAEQGQFVRQGMLCGADDSGYNQAYEAVKVARDILSKGANPATYPARAPKRGALIVNRERAKMLGIELRPESGVEEFVDRAEALQAEGAR